MYRLIGYIIAMVIALLLPDSRIRSAYPGRRYNPYFQLFEDDNNGVMRISGDNGLADRIRAGIRRRKALRKCKKFLTKENYILTVKNKFVILVMDTKNKTLSCIDLKTKGRASTVIWAEHPLSQLDRIDNIFEQTFDNICVSFNENANYKGITKILGEFFQLHETSPKTTSVKDVTILDEVDKPIAFTEKHIKITDINSATENELAQLVGINIIMAKRIIKYRELHDGFKNAEEFFKEFKIKPHFQKKLEPQISFNKINKKKKKKSTQERIIDF